MAVKKKSVKKQPEKGKKNSRKKYSTGGSPKRNTPVLKMLRILMIISVVLVVLVIVGWKKLPGAYSWVSSFVSGRTNKDTESSVMEKSPFSLEEKDLNDSFYETSKLLGITDDNYSIRNKEDRIEIRAGINYDEIDLVEAASIFQGKIEERGARLDSSKQSPDNRSMEMKFVSDENPKPYILKVYYGDYGKKKKEIYLIVDDFGSYTNELLDDFCRLDSTVTFAIIPNEPYYYEVMVRAYASDHDILIHIPMEPIDIKNHDPGEKAILVNNTPARNKEYTREYIEMLPLAIGANNHMGSLATSMESVMRPVLEVLKEHNLFFIDSFTTANSIVSSAAEKEMLPCDRRDIFLDNEDLLPANMEAKMEKLRQIAVRKDQIIVIAHCHNKEKYDFIVEFMNRAKAENFEFIKISNLFPATKEVS